MWYLITVLFYSIYPPFIGETACLEYNDITPVVYFGFLGIQSSFLLLSSFLTSSSLFSSPLKPMILISLFSISNRIKSPSSINAIGPPSAASGETCPIAGPLLAPEKRPSVIRAIDLFYSSSEEIASVV